ncbi:hypothetical protein HK104_001025, partial [Borealophlyctis nickersoniae]
MKTAIALAVAGAAALVDAHTYISNVGVNGVFQNEGVCIRPYNPVAGQRNYPIKDVRTADIKCGWSASTKHPTQTCTLPAGSKLTLEWHHDSRSPTDDIIAESHHGPCLVYMSRAGEDTWFKVFEDAGNVGGRWCTDRIRSNGGKLEFTVPAVLASGAYDVRGEIIALHESDTDFLVDSSRGAQFYVHCVGVNVT